MQQAGGVIQKNNPTPLAFTYRILASRTRPKQLDILADMFSGSEWIVFVPKD